MSLYEKLQKASSEEGVKDADEIENFEILDISTDMEIVQVFNDAANTFVNEAYIIKNVIQHIPRSVPFQDSIDFRYEGNN